MNTTVDQYIDHLDIWKEETQQMRKILLESKLNEEFKWGKPCYTYNGKNVVVIQPFKKYFAILFLKGHLLSDPDRILVKTGPNTKVGRQIRFKDAKEIIKLKSIVKKYIKEAADILANTNGS